MQAIIAKIESCYLKMVCLQLCDMRPHVLKDPWQQYNYISQYKDTWNGRFLYGSPNNSDVAANIETWIAPSIRRKQSLNFVLFWLDRKKYRNKWEWYCRKSIVLKKFCFFFHHFQLLYTLSHDRLTDRSRNWYIHKFLTQFHTGCALFERYIFYYLKNFLLLVVLTTTYIQRRIQLLQWTDTRSSYLFIYSSRTYVEYISHSSFLGPLS